MIMRSSLAEQLREYQTRSKNDWATVSFSASASSSNTPSRVDVMFVLWELLMFALLVFSVVALYFRHMKLSFLLVCIPASILVCMSIIKQVKQNRKSKRRMLLPESM